MKIFKDIVNKLEINKEDNLFEPYLMHLMDNFKNTNFSINNNYQFGGGKLSFIHNNIKLIFKIVDTTDKIIIKLHDKDNNFYCISIIIEKSQNIASIKYITAKPDCIIPKEYNTGTFLLEATILFLRKYHKQFNINIITLLDEANINCGKDKIILSQLKILTSGHTWYSKPRHDIFCNKSCKNKNCIYINFGFIPYFADPKENNDIIRNKIKKNILIISEKINKYPNILNIINKHIKETKLNEFIIKNMFNEYKNEPVWYFFKKLLLNYDKYCVLFNLIYQEIFLELNLFYFNNYKYYYFIQKLE
jgi:hypothetical protein